MCLGLMHKDMAVFVHSIQLVSSLGAERVYSCTSQWFKLLLIGVYQLKPEILPNLFQQPVNLLIPKHCAFFWNIGIEGERPSVQKASFCVQKASFRVQNGRIRTLSKPAPFFPPNICLECFGGHHHPIQPILSQPFSDLQSRDGQESVQMDQKRHHGF